MVSKLRCGKMLLRTLQWLQTFSISLFLSAFSFHFHRMDNLCSHRKATGISILRVFLSRLCLFPPICLVVGIIVFIGHRKEKSRSKKGSGQRGPFARAHPAGRPASAFPEPLTQPRHFSGNERSILLEDPDVSSSSVAMNPSCPSSSSTQKPPSPSFCDEEIVYCVFTISWE